jgi:hypothetical protein
LLNNNYVLIPSIKQIHEFFNVEAKACLIVSVSGMAGALRIDLYEGVVSFESVYHPGNGDYEAGFRLNIEKFMNLFN